MKTTLRERLTYANVMATIAVFIALGGASYAAIKLPKNSVGPREIKRNAVTLAKIAPPARSALRGAVGASGAAGPAGPVGERGPAGPETATPRSVRWFAYRTADVPAAFDFGTLQLRTSDSKGYILDFCRTGDLSAAAKITVKTGAIAYVDTIPAGAECIDNNFSPPNEFEIAGLGSRVFGTRPANGSSANWELLGYDTVE